MKKTWVIKAGSKMVCDGGLLLMRTWMQQIKKISSTEKVQIIWVTSGAIAWASQKTDFKKKNRSLPEKQALSAIGQPLIMDQYNLAVASEKLSAAQVLLTSEDIKNMKRKKNLQNTLKQLLKWNIIPILNENDAVSTAEIQFGDNDSLAAQVAVMMKAEKLILLTDVNGLFDSDPNTNKKAQLIPYLKNVKSSDLKKVDPHSKSSVGTGGMYSKLKAAKTATQAKITTHLVKGDEPNNLLDIFQSKIIGTQIGGKHHAG